MLAYRQTFISHAQSDTTLCTPYVQILSLYSIPCWFDATPDHAEQQLSASVLELLRASQAFVIMISAATSASPRVWLELSAFLAAQAAARIEDQPVVVPVRLEPVEMPLHLSSFPWIDAVGRPIEQVGAEIAARLALPAAPAPLFATPMPPYLTPAPGATPTRQPAPPYMQSPTATPPLLAERQPSQPTGYLDARPILAPTPRGRTQSGRMLILALFILLALVGTSGLLTVYHTNSLAAQATQTARTQATGTANTALVNHLTAVAQATDVVATAQSADVTATAVASLSYHAASPGPCDTGPAQWLIADPVATKATCVAGGMRLTNPYNSGEGSNLAFSWPGHSFPATYTVAVTISAITGSPSCGGLATHQTAQGMYQFFFCSYGIWQTYRNYTPLESGSLAGATAYHVQITVAGTTQTVVANGVTLVTLHDATYQTTDFIALRQYGYDMNGTSSVFSNFVYTPNT
jgi:hypothetical protein